jgi:dihydrofolate reductase
MLRRVRLFIATSLDGYIAGPNDALDWLFTDEDYGYDEFIEDVDTLAMGRRTFETVLGIGDWPYDGKRTYVFSRGASPPLDPRVVYTSQTPMEWVTSRCAEDGKSLWVVGGGQLIRAFLDAYLVDEIAIAVHPVILGGGVPLVPEGTHRHALRLVNHRAYRSGLVMNTYAVQR